LRNLRGVTLKSMVRMSADDSTQPAAVRMDSSVTRLTTARTQTKIGVYGNHASFTFSMRLIVTTSVSLWWRCARTRTPGGS
jgi:hypothetical protein